MLVSMARPVPWRVLKTELVSWLWRRATQPGRDPVAWQATKERSTSQRSPRHRDASQRKATVSPAPAWAPAAPASVPSTPSCSCQARRPRACVSPRCGGDQACRVAACRPCVGRRQNVALRWLVCGAGWRGLTSDCLVRGGIGLCTAATAQINSSARSRWRPARCRHRPARAPSGVARRGRSIARCQWSR